MIDTDKYEGHTKGPWKWLKNSILLKGRAYATNKNAHFPSFIITGRHLDGGWPIDNEADAQLIANAPLLLAEVKRLQAALKEAVEVVKEMESMAYADADADKFANHALEFIGNVKELIE
tara:strand:- start:8273 stop:8629 length:357 start_codon:yes stop_codon:yes gene_type:complete